jgi:hypothetical protein
MEQCKFWIDDLVVSDLPALLALGSLISILITS